MNQPTIFFVYILQSQTTKRFYIGSTDNLIRRFHQHQSNYSKATKGKGPWWMPYYEICESRSAAVKRERDLKLKKSATSIRRTILYSLPNLNVE